MRPAIAAGLLTASAAAYITWVALDAIRDALFPDQKGWNTR